MDGEISQKERILKAFQIVHQTEQSVPDVSKIEAVIYAMANKFLDAVELKQLKEEIKMTELGYLIFNDGVEQEASENAKNLLQNGVSFELVRKSIHHISDEALQAIYDEVMASQNK